MNSNSENSSKKTNNISIPTSPNLTTFSNKNLSTFENYITLINQTNIDITILILSFLQYSDIINLKRTNNYLKSFFSSKKIMRYYIISGNINKNNRLSFYLTNISISKQYEKIKSELLDYNIENNFYFNILKLVNSQEQISNPNFKKTLEEINNDITRTCFTKKFENGNGKIYLKNILTAFAFIRPEIGYCQGMNFIAAALIDLIYNEEKVFWVFLSFIDDNEINTLYFKNMFEYNIRFYQLNFYFEKYFPEIHEHFIKENLNPEIFFSKWILTVFSNYLNFNILYDVWDLFIIDKWKAIFKISLILINLMKEDFLNLTMNNLQNFFKENEFKKNDFDFDDIVDGYDEYKITNSKLKELKEDFYIEQVQQKLKNNVWESDQEQLINDYQININKYMKDFNKKYKKFNENIEKLDKIISDDDKFYENLNVQIKELTTKIEKIMKEKENIENNIDFNIDDLDDNFDNKSNNNHNLSSNNDKNKLNLLFDKDEINNNDNNNILKTETNEKKSKKYLKNIRNKNNKKIKNLEKDIENFTKILIEKISLRDEKKSYLNFKIDERKNIKENLDKIVNEKNLYEKNLLKNLSQKLKLSAKFVKTNNY